MDIIIRKSIVLILFLVLPFFCTQTYFILCLGMNISCKESERTALLTFKQDLRDPFDKLSSWSGENCCRWAGVVCSNKTDHVVQLHLQELGLGGEQLNPSLQVLKQLRHLDLSQNNFNSTLPEWLYSLTNLQQLDLSHNNNNPLSYNDHSLATYGFHGRISASIGNLTKLTLLDLSWNRLEGEIPIAIGNLYKLQTLNLQYNQLSGRLPNELGRLKHLYDLVLTDNSFSGSILLSIGRLSLLERLNLRNNKLNGSVAEILGNLSKLRTLDLTKNDFEGVVSEVHFANMTNLQDLSINSLVLKMSPGWVPPFQLKSADLGSCQLGPGFPMWLKTQRNLRELVLYNTGISGTIPTWFWNMTYQVSGFDLSHNELTGEIPIVLTGNINLGSNQFSGQLPRVSPIVSFLDLSNNSFSGPISTFLCNPFSENNVLKILHLSDNLLSGNLSDCWVYWIDLVSLRLGGNKITGRIPSSMGSYLLSLKALHLGDNSLSGELPTSLGNCTSLISIDLGENGFTGRLPIWLAERIPYLRFLRLRSNKFYGEIPLEFCYLDFIRVLDIAYNDLRGSIPKCFNKFSYIKERRYLIVEQWYLGGYVDRTALVTKGRELEYGATLAYFTSLDLSKNSFSGEIPEELTSLSGLVSFNLSWNCLTGKIPEKIGNMSSLESLDFSNNNISGVIPPSISSLSTLNNLNLSYNNLSGKIPLGTQLQSFNEFSFIGNQELCGLPLKKCNEEEPPQKPPGDRELEDEDEDWFEMKWFYMSMGVGFAVGFWLFWGVLVFKKSWRIAYFRFLDEMKDKICLLF